MFVAVFYWVLTVFFLIVYITMTYTRIPQVPWTTVVSLPQGPHQLGAVRWDRECLCGFRVTSAHIGQAMLEKPGAANDPSFPDGLSLGEQCVHGL